MKQILITLGRKGMVVLIIKYNRMNLESEKEYGSGNLTLPFSFVSASSLFPVAVFVKRKGETQLTLKFVWRGR
jgi:hypothetical protein